MAFMPIRSAFMEDTMPFSPASCRCACLPHILIFAALLVQLVSPNHLWAIGQPYVVKEINASGHAIDPSSVNPIAALGNTIIFAANDGAKGIELWKSDGSPAGTVLLKDISTGSSNPSYLTPLNGKVVFRATDTTNGIELWATDGTTAGTQLLADIYPGTTSSTPQKFTQVGNTLYIVAATASGSKLWKTDGTPAGTMLASEFTPGFFSSIDSLTAAGDKLQVVTFLSGSTATWDLWSVDPVAGTTERITTFLSQPKYLTPCNGKTFFSLYTGGYGEELWLSDGTESGTGLVRDIDPSGSAMPYILACVDSTIYFRATEPTYGSELWKSDGTLARTVMVQDINPGAASSNPWAAKNFNGKLLFRATDAASGSELWTSDGTGTGTVLVKDINPGSVDGFEAPNNLAVAGNLAFFGATDGAHGNEVWVTDGTAGNAYQLADLNPGSYYAAPGNFTVVGNTLYFSAKDSSWYFKLMAATLSPGPTTQIVSPLTDTSVSVAVVSVTGEAHSDTGSLVTLVEVSTDNGVSWNPASGTTSWSYSWEPTGEGIYSLLSRATDLLGVVGPAGPAVQVTVDRTAPSGWLNINNNAAMTTAAQVTLEVTASALDPGLTCEFFTPPYICGTVSIRFSNNGTGWSAWEAAQTVRSWTLPAGDGDKIVYAQLKDRAGNTTDISSMITLDTSQVPSSTITSPVTGFASNGSSVIVAGTAAPGPGGGTITLVEVSADGGTTWLPAAGTASWSISLSLPAAGSYTIKSRARTSTLVETPTSGIAVTIDRSPPSGMLALYNGIWTLNASDGGICIQIYPFICGSLEMSFNSVTWIPATTQPGTGGPLWLRDKAGNVSLISGGSIINPNGGPIQISSYSSGYYSFVQHAYDAALNGDLIKISNNLTENLTLARSINLTLRGGYASGFATVTGTTPITGNLTVKGGTTSLENIDLNGIMAVEGGSVSAENLSVR